jgi:mono/diheme cytochrome c family protein
MRVALSLACVLVAAAAVWPQERSQADKDAFFQQRIAPLLEQRCLSCHNADKLKGDLDLSTRDLALAGGEKGPALVPGDAGKSLLVKMVSGPEPRMPRMAKPLSDAEVADLRRWIDDGAAWPKGVTLAAKAADKGDWWSYQPLLRPPLPAVKDAAWCQSPIDAFVRAAQEERGLAPAEPAGRATYIRRVTYDLLGLPPTPQEIDDFVNDESPDAFEVLIDRLLASPLYGERWARLWLDLIHYADTHGFDKDKRRLWAWLFRDWVIGAFNRDLPYRRFVRYQLAGDVLYPADPGGAIATGFIAAGPWDFVGHVELREGTVEKEKTRTLDRDDMVMNTMATFVSQTVHCARCHDHKFDPISQKDYYQLQAVFAGVERGDRPVLGKDGRWAKVYTALPTKPRPIHVLQRGDVERKGDLVAAGALSLLPQLPGNFKLAEGADEGQRRAALAAWITADDNPLTWRSIVNRVWQYHFGKGLVDTPSDYGHNGAKPSHPALLDWLAAEFRSADSFKRLHRLILLSATYRQSCTHNAANAKIDADNRYLWRMNRQRLDAESIRDAVLFVSGTLSFRAGGPGFELFRFKDDHSPVYDHLDPDKINDPATWRRTVYRFVVRSVPNPFLDSLDGADPNVNVPVRNTTLTALQALAMMNNPLMVKQAEHFAARLQKATDDPARQVELAYRLAFGRPPSAAERDALAAYIRRHGLANGCRLLFNANEFVFVD